MNEIEALAEKIGDLAYNHYKNSGKSFDVWYEGTNGPYNHREPPLRSVCHFLILFCNAEGLKNSIKYDDFRASLREYLKDQLRDPIIFRTQKNLDAGNGVIGAAWLMEAIRLSSRNESEDLNRYYQKITRMFPFDAETGLVRRQSADRSYGGGVDKTLNHQLWFLAELALSPLGPANQRQINKSIMYFAMDDCYFDGVIFHKTGTQISSGFKSFIKRFIYYPKSVSYQCFNQVALRRLSESGLLNKENSHTVKRFLDWEPNLFHLLVWIVQKHGMSYNPVGFELRNGSRHKNSASFFQTFFLKRAIKDHECARKRRLLSRVYEGLNL